MKPLSVSKPFLGLAALLLIVQMACAASSISSTPKPGSTTAGSSQATQSSPVGGAQNTQSAPAPVGQATQASPSAGGQATQGVPSTGGQATPADAQAMLAQVAQHYQSAGRDQALKDFSDQKAPFNDPNLFVMCIASDHKVSAMGGFPLLVGFSADNITEITGRPMGSLIWGAATINPQGSIPFTWKNPLSGTVESKVIYYQKLSQDVCGVVGTQP